MLDRSEDGPPRKSLISDKQAAAIKKNSRKGDPYAAYGSDYKKASARADADNKRLIANPAILRRVAAQRKARDAAKKGR